MARKPYIPDDPSTLFDFELGDVHRLRDPAGHRVRFRARSGASEPLTARTDLESFALRERGG